MKHPVSSSLCQTNLTKENSLRLVGCLLLLSGFALVLAALAMLPALAERMAFAAAGLGVEVLGLALLTQGYKSLQTDASPSETHSGLHPKAQR